VKILVDNSGYELLNHGDTAMLKVALERFARLFPDAEIHVYTTSPENLARHCPGTIPVPKELTLKGRQVWKLMWNVFGFTHRFIPSKRLKYQLELFEFKLIVKHTDRVRPWVSWRLARRGADVQPMHATLDLIKSADLVVATGGGYLTDSFELHARRILMTLAIAHFYKKPTALLGQGIGPIRHRFLRDIARFSLPRLDLISLREGREGPPLLEEYKVAGEKITVTGDDAIEFAYRQRPAQLGGDIGINLRVAYYSKLNESLVVVFKPALGRLKTERRVRLRAIPISTYHEESDAASIRRVFGDMLDHDGSYIGSPEEVVKEVGLCRVVITGSYHAGVFALSQGISVICLASSEYYVHKFQGLAAQFGSGCAVVAINDDRFVESFEAAFAHTWANAEKIRGGLLAAAEHQIQLSLAVYEDFAKKVLAKTG
jgi:polysaccharide pyruvyl transferase WcaK-like protein